MRLFKNLMYLAANFAGLLTGYALWSWIFDVSFSADNLFKVIALAAYINSIWKGPSNAPDAG